MGEVAAMTFLSAETEHICSFISLVRLEGEADLLTAQTLKNAVRSLIGQGVYDVIVNLDGLKFIDCSGLEALVSARKETREHGGNLSLICTSPYTRKILHITGLDKLFKVHSDQVQALCGFALDMLELVPVA